VSRECRLHGLDRLRPHRRYVVGRVDGEVDTRRDAPPDALERPTVRERRVGPEHRAGEPSVRAAAFGVFGSTLGTAVRPLEEFCRGSPAHVPVDEVPRAVHVVGERLVSVDVDRRE
jgi:hypothetical protein